MKAPLAIAACALVLAGPTARAAYREVTVTGGGAIAGQVKLVGELPALPPQPVFKHQDVCGASLPDPRLVVEPSGALQNAVVFLADVKEGKPIPRSEPVRLDNVKCSFVPHVLSATVGQMLEIHNSDPFLHDAHGLLGSRTVFNVAVPKGHTARRPLAYAGLIHINCNVRHTWMHAYLYVSEHPYHTVTGPGGRFRIEQIPPGTYTLTVWHELLGSTDQQVKVESGNTTEVALELSATVSGGEQAPAH